MPLVASNIPNLIGGVSQQPQSLRLPTSCAELVNAWPSVVTGNNKRPPTEFIAKLPITVDKGAVGYLIDREGSYRYIVVVTNGDLKVYDLNGVAQTVTFPDGKAYLSEALFPVDSFRLLTVGDTTFILNRERLVEAEDFGEVGAESLVLTGTVATVGLLPGVAALGDTYKVNSPLSYWRYTAQAGTPAVFGWQQSGTWTTINNGSTIYDVLPTTVTSAGINAQLRRSYVTYVTEQVGNGTDGSTSVTREVTITEYLPFTSVLIAAATAGFNYWRQLNFDEITRTTTGRIDPTGRATVHVTQTLANTFYMIYINNILRAQFLTGNGVTVAAEGTDQIASDLTADLNTAGFTATRIGSTICLSNLPAGATIYASAGQGDKAIKAYIDTVNTFQALPPNETEGRIVRILGNVEENGDDYYVIYQKGLWVETYKFLNGSRPLASTMPHVLVRNADGTWTFKRHSWDQRLAGDKDSNPNPSFIGTKINDMFFYSGRLGFLADENVILSETNNFENFYRTSLATLLDSDRLDYAVFNQGVDVLRHAVPFDKDLLLMSDRAQFRFTYQNFLGPKNAQVLFSTTFLVSPTVRPASIGDSIYFLDDKGEYTFAKVFEYYPKENQTGDQADEATGPVPQYLPANVGVMTGSPRLKCLAFANKFPDNRIWLYKFFWAGQNKIQNAWFTWEFPDCQQVLWCDFSKNYFYVLLKRSDGIFLERIRVDEQVYEPGRYVIDAQVDKVRMTLSYNSGTDKTTVTMPYGSTQTFDLIGSFDSVDPEQVITHFRFDVTRVNSTQFTVDGDITGWTFLTAGIPYEWRMTFNEFFIRDKSNTGSPAQLDTYRLQARYLSLNFNDTSYLKSTLLYPGRAPIIGYYESKTIGSPLVIVGKTSSLEGVWRVPLVGSTQDLTLTLSNDSPYPSSVTSAEVFLIYTPKAKARL